MFDFPLDLLDLFDNLFIKTGSKSIPLDEIGKRTDILKLTHDDTNFHFINKQGDLFSLNKALIAVQGDDEEEKGVDYSFLYSKSEFSLEGVDQTNPFALLKRQKDILSKLEQKKENVDPFSIVKSLKNWVIILCHGGKFTITVFEKNKLILNKSESKYVIRKKGGNRQINKDKVAKVMNSVGSQMRRENEKLLQLHIEEILEETAPHLEKADVIFLHAPGINRLLFVKENRPLHKHEYKVKKINLSSKKANFTEAMQLAEKIMQIKLKFLNTV